MTIELYDENNESILEAILDERNVIKSAKTWAPAFDGWIDCTDALMKNKRLINQIQRKIENISYDA